MPHQDLLKRILYIQYTNPAGYPPLEHSSRILAGDEAVYAALPSRSASGEPRPSGNSV